MQGLINTVDCHEHRGLPKISKLTKKNNKIETGFSLKIEVLKPLQAETLICACKMALHSNL